jgi:hypothetical protein
MKNLYHISPEYRAWYNMKYRCYNPNYRDSKMYLGRGIEVCSKWLNNPKSFMDYMGKKPTPHHSLDRTDNNGNYEPNNCRWSDKRVQVINRSILSNPYGYPGIRKLVSKYKGER